MTVTGVEITIGIVIAYIPHIAKFFRTYEVSFKAGSRSAFRWCFKCIPRKGKKAKGSEKGSMGSDTMQAEKQKPRKLYLGLEISTRGGTQCGTVYGIVGDFEIDDTRRETDIERGNQDAEDILGQSPKEYTRHYL
ncbi:hypothetical protein OCU04_012373 [Sclerotinia nivalis]|uniref:Uncharacterized protein n=1 Tax=Sclerotinia nivalis TaxID=352851 RepID=A0A9X0AAT0_9HELO|nr:hypothetical protein OCU04_012373 [Sclerotinia nivalis]